MSFKDAHSDKPGSPLGLFGYFFKLLEIAGYALYLFAVGDGLPHAVLQRRQKYLKPYCTAYIHSTELST